MKRTNRFLGILFCLGVAVLAVPASADESFTLNIPVRGDASQETGEVRVILGLDSPPAGGESSPRMTRTSPVSWEASPRTGMLRVKLSSADAGTASTATPRQNRIPRNRFVRFIGLDP